MPDREIRLAIDLAHTRQSQAGVTRYALELADALARRDDTTVIRLGAGTPLRRGTIKKKAVTLYHDLLWYPLLGHHAAARIGADVYHCPSERAPLHRIGTPLVVTVHDVTFRRHPETMSTWNRRYTAATLRRVLASADRVLAPSADTADDLARELRVPADKLRVVPNAASDIFFSPAPAEPPVPYPYVLFVGTPEPRKNLPRLTDAVALLRTRGRPHRLVVAGGNGWGAVALPPDVTVLGRVSDEELHRLYAHASCLAIPSLHEGFGIPAVEAMAAGCAVVASSAGALPEVCGDGAVYVDPLSVRSIADGLAAAIDGRDDLIARGRARARGFRWSASAERLVRVYRELV